MPNEINGLTIPPLTAGCFGARWTFGCGCWRWWPVHTCH